MLKQLINHILNVQIIMLKILARICSRPRPYTPFARMTFRDYLEMRDADARRRMTQSMDLGGELHSLGFVYDGQTAPGENTNA